MIKKNCLVIGGTGFIGYHLLKKLSKKKKLQFIFTFKNETCFKQKS